VRGLYQVKIYVNVHLFKELVHFLFKFIEKYHGGNFRDSMFFFMFIVLIIIIFHVITEGIVSVSWFLSTRRTRNKIICGEYLPSTIFVNICRGNFIFREIYYYCYYHPSAEIRGRRRKRGSPNRKWS
jgi:hypothetical protein